MQVLKVKYETVLKQKVLSKMSLETRVAKPEFLVEPELKYEGAPILTAALRPKKVKQKSYNVLK